MRVVLIIAAAIALAVAVWCVFSSGEPARAETEQEARLAAILSKIEGIEGVDVMIGEENGAPVSVVVVFRGKDGILTRKRLSEAAAGALNLERSSVLVYPSRA